MISNSLNFSACGVKAPIYSHIVYVRNYFKVAMCFFFIIAARFPTQAEAERRLRLSMKLGAAKPALGNRSTGFISAFINLPVCFVRTYHCCILNQLASHNDFLE